MREQSEKFREELKIILSQNLPLNTCQVCRLYNGAKGRNDINFCTSGTKDKWTDEGNFKKHGNFPYRNCRDHKTKHRKIYYHLRVLEKQGEVESRLEFRSDPIVIGRKDKMRMWALKGKLPSLRGFMN